MRLSLRFVLASVVVVCSLCFWASCRDEKPPQSSRIIGVATFVDHVVLNTIRDAFVRKMNELGYSSSNGWRIVVKSANGQPSQATAVAEDLINLGPVLLVSISTPSTKGVLEKNRGRIPQVYSFVSFPQAIGIGMDSPNITGLSDGVDFQACFDLIRTVVPNLKKLGMVYSDEPNAVTSKDRISALCGSNGVTFIGQSVAGPTEVKAASQSLAAAGVDAVFIGADNVVVDQAGTVVEVFTQSRVPIFSTDEGSVKLGVLAALSVNYEKFGEQTAVLADRVIKTGRADVTTRQDYLGKDVVLNAATAKTLRIEFPQTLLRRAVKVFPIEGARHHGTSGTN